MSTGNRAIQRGIIKARHLPGVGWVPMVKMDLRQGAPFIKAGPAFPTEAGCHDYIQRKAK